MSNTPHRPAARRGLRKHGSRGDVAPVSAAAAANHAGSHTRRKNMTPLRSYASFPALVADPPAPPAFNIDELCAAKRPASNTAIVGGDGGGMPGARHPGYGGRRGLLHSSVSSGDPDDFDLDTPPFSRQASAALLPPLPGDPQLQRTPSERRRHGYSQQSLLGCLTPTPARTMMDSPAGMHSVHSVSPSPSPTPYHASRTTHRRLTFTPAEMAAVAASGSVAGINSVNSSNAGSASPASHQLSHAPSTMFTPPATKLVRPDPSVFTSTGLLSKKQQARTRSSSGNNNSNVGGGDGDSFIPPETPCKRAGAAVDSAGKPIEAGSSMKVSSNDPRFAAATGGRARAHSGLATPNASSSSFHHHYQSPALPGVHLDMDPFRLGKHRNTSTDSLRRTRKKPHLGPPADELDDINSLFDTPCRPRQNTLVDDDFMQRPPPGFRIPAGPEAPSSSVAAAGAARPLPPSFAPQHQFLIQSLAAENLVDPDAAPWDIGSSAGSRVSWAASSDAGSISSAVTLAPSARSPGLHPQSGTADDSGAHRRKQQQHGQQQNARQTPYASRRQRIPLFRKDSTGSNCGGSGVFGTDDDSRPNSRFFDAMELDFELGRNGSVDGGDGGDGGNGGDGGDGDDDDVFSPRAGSGHRRGRSVGALPVAAEFGRSSGDDILRAGDRQQLPPVVQGCATSYPHFLGREYFWQADRSLPFLAPSSELLVADGRGYADYFEQHFEVVARAGEGNFSSVVSARSLDDGQLYAVKKTRQPFAGRQERARRLREVELLWMVPQCAGIVRLVNAWEQAGHLHLQFELCERGSLEEYLDRRAQADGRVSEAHAWAILAHAAHALNRLHESDVAHLDVKPANFLLGARFGQPGAEQHEGWLKLADFGHAVRLPHEPRAWVEEGDREYMAPEVLRGVYSKAADVFSLGMMMLEITADIVLPDNGVDWHKLREACFDDRSFDDLPYSLDLVDSIKLMLHPDPARRPALAQILALPQCSIYTPPSAVRAVEDGFAQVSVRERQHAGYLHSSLLPRVPLMARASTAGADGSPMHPSVHPMVTRSVAAANANAGSNSGAGAAPRLPPPPPAARVAVAPRAGSGKRSNSSSAVLARRTASAPGTSPQPQPSSSSSSTSRGSAQATAAAH
ncbi:mitosis inhibitor protein kinase swe1 [Coemansia sp. RSA 1200]|nr:mitosis inhibitor protein kinase swe1 [Coemansia sp. RSA 1200]